MNLSSNPIDMLSVLKAALLVAIPTTLVFLVLWVFAKGKSQKPESKIDPLQNDILKESMQKIAQEKIAQREEEPEPENEQKLDKNEIAKVMENEREQYNEFELVDPLDDLKPDSKMKKEPVNDP